MKKLLLLIVILFAGISVAFAQKTLSGTVVDDQGIPLPGATVLEQGTTNGVSTDFDGNFSIEVSEGAVLAISFVGYQSKEITVGAEDNISVALEAGSELEEVVIVGYGTVKKSDLTGAVTDLNAKDFVDEPVTSIDKKLVGRVAGMQVKQSSGAPGAGSIITIRGNGSLGAGNEPLYVVDGMPYTKMDNEDINPLAFINPDDIESISILKDASSTAIYGSRGANGVILISTINAGKDITEINFSSFTGVNQIPQKGRPDMMNAFEFATLQRAWIAQGIRSSLNREPVESDYPVEYQNPVSLGEGTDWYDLILRTSFMKNYNLNIQKSIDKSNFYLGLGYAENEGVVTGTGLTRYSANFKYSINLNDKIIVEASLRPTFLDQDITDSGNSRNDYLSIALWASPLASPYDDNGNLVPFLHSPKSSVKRRGRDAWGFPNPLFALQNIENNSKTFRNFGNVSLQWNIRPELSFKTALFTIYNNGEINEYTPSTIGRSNRAPGIGNGTAYKSRNSGFNWLWENTVNYHKSFQKHSLSALAGYTTQKSRSRGLYLTAGPFANDFIHTINAATDIISWSESINEWSIISYLGRLNYSFNNRYLLTATLRSDGSSRFGENKRFALFPSTALAWKVSEEDFLKDINIINHLKVRATYGRSGNNNIGNYTHLSTINLSQYVFDNTSVSASTLGISNPNLGWEESNQIDLGVDLSMFDNRISFTADLYRKKSMNMLLNDYIPTITGFNTQLVNKGSVENKGLELALRAVPFRGDFTLDFNFNIAFNQNKILSTNNNNDPIYTSNVDRRFSNISEVGQPIGMFYGFILDGVYSEEDLANSDVPKHPGAYVGMPKYVDVNGDGIVQEEIDYTVIGNPHPDFTYGFSTSMQFKNFDMSFNLSGIKGGNIVNGARQTIDNVRGYFNVQKEWVNLYHSSEEPGDGMHGGPQISHRLNTLWIEDASFMRINNLTVGYTLPKKLTNTTKAFENFRVYASAQNLLTITNYQGANPEGQASNVNNTLSPGWDWNAYPLSRTITLGINAKF